MASTPASSPRGGFPSSRSHSILSDDLSSVPPEEPEWLVKVAARSRTRGGGCRSRGGSRRNSALITSTPPKGLLPIAPSPLRNSTSATNVAAGGGGEGGGGGGGGAAGYDGPLASWQARPDALYDRFGSVEGLSAAVDDFYHRLCADESIGDAVREVPAPDVRHVIMQLMALSLADLDEGDEAGGGGGGGGGCGYKDRHVWLEHCSSLLRQAARSQAPGEQQGAAAAAMDASTYDAVMAHLTATLTCMGASRDRATADADAGMAAAPWHYHRGGSSGEAGPGALAAAR